MRWRCGICREPVELESRGGRHYFAPHEGCRGSGELAMLPRSPAMQTAFPVVRSAGKPRCRYCGGDVEPPRRSWCRDECVRSATVACGRSATVRALLWRDRGGICDGCGRDVGALVVARLWGLEGAIPGGEWAFRTLVGETRADRRTRLERLGFNPGATPWEADHRIPVSEGGGGCGLDGYDLLCWPCHRLGKTAAEQRRRARDRRRADFIRKGGLFVPRQLGLTLKTPTLALDDGGAWA